MAIDLSLLAIADLSVVPPERLVDLTLAAARGGATSVQLRGKELAAADLLASADELRPILSRWGVPLLVNDRADVALLAGALGVHLGDDDLEVGAARSLLGSRAVIGRTARTPEAATRAAAEGADYVGSGSVYAGGTKGGVPILGLPGLAAVVAASPLPVVAIGGIDADRARDCVAVGAAGVAVIGALFAGEPDAAQVEARARRLRAAVEAGRLESPR